MHRILSKLNQIYDFPQKNIITIWSTECPLLVSSYGTNSTRNLMNGQNDWIQTMMAWAIISLTLWQVQLVLLEPAINKICASISECELFNRILEIIHWKLKDAKKCAFMNIAIKYFETKASSLHHDFHWMPFLLSLHTKRI